MIVSINRGVAYVRIDPGSVAGLVDARWIGRCKHCGKTHKLEGRLTIAKRVGTGTNSDYVIDTGADHVYTTSGHGSDTSKVSVECLGGTKGSHWCTLQRVLEGKKKSKHACGARCTSSTGPNCDCRCKGANHGSSC